MKKQGKLCNMVRKNDGITLIALVVTIIVLLILVGVTLSLIGGSDGILGKAEKAVEQTNNSWVKEEVELAILEKMTEYYENYADYAGTYRSALDYAKAEFAESKNYTTSSGATIVYDETNDQFIYTKNDKETIMTVDDNGSVTIAGTEVSTKRTVSYNTNGGEGAVPASASYEIDAEVTVQFSPVPTRTGYTFLGWATNSSATVAEYTESGTKTFIMGKNNVALYAVWKNQKAGMTASNRNRTLSGETTGYTYKNPVIPQGFNAIDTIDAKWEYTDSTAVEGWNNGLVIEDASNGNQFVWVPVDGSNVTYAKWCTVGYSYADCLDDTNVYPVSDENSQITKYQGFYVARYESGNDKGVITIDSSIDTSSSNNIIGIPVSKAGTKVWNYISYTNAAASAKLMVDNSTNYGNNKSGLITGTQWDTIMKWYSKSEITVDTTQDWGTYYNLAYSVNGKHFLSMNGVLQDWISGSASHIAENTEDYLYHGSGLNSNGIKKNIADLGGNLWEWTAETYSSNSVVRGGVVYYSSVEFPSSYRKDSSETVAGCHIGFRVVLYIE